MFSTVPELMWKLAVIGGLIWAVTFMAQRGCESPIELPSELFITR